MYPGKKKENSITCWYFAQGHSLVLYCTSSLCIISHLTAVYASWEWCLSVSPSELTREVNRHFLPNVLGDLLFFSFLELGNYFLLSNSYRLYFIAHKRAWDLPFLFQILLSLKIYSQHVKFDNNLSACSMEWLYVSKIFYQYVHTYIYYLLRQVGLRQPKGWCGPADNLKKKKRKKTIFI